MLQYYAFTIFPVTCFGCFIITTLYNISLCYATTIYYVFVRVVVQHRNMLQRLTMTMVKTRHKKNCKNACNKEVLQNCVDRNKCGMNRISFISTFVTPVQGLICELYSDGTILTELTNVSINLYSYHVQSSMKLRFREPSTNQTLCVTRQTSVQLPL